MNAASEEINGRLVDFNRAWLGAQPAAAGVTVEAPPETWSERFRLRRRRRFAPGSHVAAQVRTTARSLCLDRWVASETVPTFAEVRSAVRQRVAMDPLTAAWAALMLLKLLAAFRDLIRDRKGDR